MKRRDLGSLVILAGFLAVGACDSSSTTSTRESPSASGAVSIDARSLAPTIATSNKPNAPPLVDLLQATESQVAVSSNVDNPKDFPEHLVDGKPETAWNGKTGDLHGWISFRVPDDALVKTISLTAGFDKKNAEGDLFTMNHRIKKVRITRNGEAVAEQALDVDKRTLQAIKIEKPGGTYRIDVLETEPGSKKEWKELCVSELRVLGNAGKIGVRAAPRIPDVRVGALSGIHVDAKTRSIANLSLAFSKPEEFCKAFRDHYTPINQARTDYPGPVETTCAATDSQSASIKANAPVAPFVDAVTYAATDDTANFSAVGFHAQKGWFFVGPILSADGIGDPHCGGFSQYLGDAKVTFTSTSRGPTALVTWHEGVEDHGPKIDDSGAITGTFANSTITFYAAVCVATDARVTCDPAVVVDRHFEDEALSVTREWRSSATPTVKPDGTIDGIMKPQTP